MNYIEMAAPCGLPCFNCPWHLAQNDKKIQQIVAKKAGVPAEQVSCGGCRHEDGKCAAFGGDGQCPTFACAKEKNVKFCHECSEFPCTHLHPYADKADVLPHNTKVFNLCLIKRMGVENWAKEKSQEVIDIYFNENWSV